MAKWLSKAVRAHSSITPAQTPGLDGRPRRVLLVFPRYAPSFGTFQYAYPIVGGKAFMPPQGLLVIAAALPKHWRIRFVDENVAPATKADFAWADVAKAYAPDALFKRFEHQLQAT